MQKVDIPLADVKSELGAEFILRTSPLIAFGTRRPDQIDQEIIRSRHLYAEHKDRVDKIITNGDYHDTCDSDERTSEPPMHDHVER